MSNKPRKQLDYKWIGLGILLMLGFAGIGYVMSLALPYFTGTTEVANINCNNLDETDWKQSPIGKSYVTLTAFQDGCKKLQHVIVVEQPKEIGFFLIFAFPAVAGFVFFTAFGIYKNDEQQNPKEDAQ